MFPKLRAVNIVTSRFLCFGPVLSKVRAAAAWSAVVRAMSDVTACQPKLVASIGLMDHSPGRQYASTRQSRTCKQLSSNSAISGSTQREFDLVVFGSTGFTGTQACKYIAEAYGLPNDKFKYAIAGRNAVRLAAVEAAMIKAAVGESEAGQKTHGEDVDRCKVSKIIASVDEKSSIVDMCRRARCVISYLSPPSAVGEVVIATCATEGTHYVDVAGEIDWVAKICERYHSTAVQSKSKILPCAGLGHVANDIPMLCLSNESKKRGYDMNNADVRQYMEVSTPGISGGSLRTFMEMFKRVPVMSLFNTLADSHRMCKQRPVVDTERKRFVWPVIHYNSTLRRWTGLSFMGPPSEAYIRWSNELQSFAWGKELKFRVLEMSNNVFGALAATAAYYVIPLAFTIVARFPFLKRLIPPTGGATFNYDKSSKTDNKYRAVVVTRAVVTDKATTPSTLKTVECRFEYGGEMYKLTCRTSVEAAMTCLFEQTPPTFGVLSPSAALGDAYVTRLSQAGVDTVVSS